MRGTGSRKSAPAAVRHRSPHAGCRVHDPSRVLSGEQLLEPAVTAPVGTTAPGPYSASTAAMTPASRACRRSIRNAATIASVRLVSSSSGIAASTCSASSRGTRAVQLTDGPAPLRTTVIRKRYDVGDIEVRSGERAHPPPTRRQRRDHVVAERPAGTTGCAAGHRPQLEWESTHTADRSTSWNDRRTAPVLVKSPDPPFPSGRSHPWRVGRMVRSLISTSWGWSMAKAIARATALGSMPRSAMRCWACSRASGSWTWSRSSVWM